MGTQQFNKAVCTVGNKHGRFCDMQCTGVSHVVGAVFILPKSLCNEQLHMPAYEVYTPPAPLLQRNAVY